MRKSVIQLFSYSIIILMSINAFAQKPVEFVIETSYGNIEGFLYDDTPLHRDNFVKLVGEGWYEGSEFHRVIKNFMIQGGHNKDGSVDPGYTIPAEITNKFFHKKGALSAARMGDHVNPKRESSGCQFYIVQGGGPVSQEMLYSVMQQSGMNYTKEQTEIYGEIGGTPHLDNQYTVFGEITTGFEIVDAISKVKTGAMDKPVEAVTMKIKIKE
jgi:peptidyl-prolyl cis-trans isomerase B (cyclophilin B)